jgi:N-acetylglucosamine-6-phosphate deacetylase
VIVAGRLVIPGGSFRGWLRVEGGVIAEVREGSPPPGADCARGEWVTPGLVDLQVNGAGGHEVTSGAEALAQIDSLMLRHGVTGYLPTVITTDEASGAACVAAARERMASGQSPVLGVHLEGPFLAPGQRGVHRAELLRVPADGVPRHYEDQVVRLATIAPELPGAIDLVRRLAAGDQCVSIGHSAASPEVAEAAIVAGARMVTHLFNAMPPFHHRAPGVAGWALVTAPVALGVIADRVHLHPDTLKLVERVAGERVVLVTDASVAAAADPGRYVQAGVEIERAEDGRVTTADGGLAGSGITLDEAVRRWIGATGAGFEAAVAAASSRPADLIGEHRTLAAGQVADLLVWSDNLRVERVLFRGAWRG